MGTLVLLSLLLSLFGSVLFVVLYGLNASIQAEGSALALASFGLSIGLMTWAKHLLPPEMAVDERERLPSPEPEREAAFSAWSIGAEAVVSRRAWLTRLLGLSGGALALSSLWIALRSLGPTPGRALFQTAWRRGDRLVREDGTPVRAADLEDGAFLTVFPERVIRTADLDEAAAAAAATVLVRVEPILLRLPPEREAWAPDGCLAYSKVCTHAGCPVGFYRRQTHQLLCPCHQSTFDVLNGASVVRGPASRSLPQLPIEVSEDGYLRASDGYSEPIGPSFWERGEG